MSPTLPGAEILARTLRRLGAEHVFGVPGTQNIPTFEGFRRARLRTVTCVHELGAAFMANGYARASGRVGIIATIPGPGFAYALAAIAEARADSAPLIHIAGQPPGGGVDRSLHQAIPQRDLARALFKEVIAVDRPDRMERAVVRAWASATEGEPGPVLLHVARSAQSERAPLRGVAHPRHRRAPLRGMDALVERLRGAERAVVFVGQGAAGAAPQVEALVERLAAPFFTTPSGRGIVSEAHPLCLRFDAERSDVGPLNELIRASDVVLALGCRMSFHGTAGFALDLAEPILAHVNADPAALKGRYPAGVGVAARIEDALPVLLDRLGDGAPRDGRGGHAGGWRARILADGQAQLPEPSWHGVPDSAPAAFFEALAGVMPPESVVVTDAGLHQVLVRRHYRVRAPRGLIMPTGLQSMGFGVPAAIGARLAVPSRPVVAVVGDGGFAMAATELLTASREGVPVVVVVINDGFLNLIRLQQMADEGIAHAVSIRNPDLRVLAGALVVGYELVDGDPEASIDTALRQRGPVIVEVVARDSRAVRELRVRGAGKRVLREAAGPRLLGQVRGVLSGR